MSNENKQSIIGQSGGCSADDSRFLSHGLAAISILNVAASFSAHAKGLDTITILCGAAAALSAVLSDLNLESADKKAITERTSVRQNNSPSANTLG